MLAVRHVVLLSILLLPFPGLAQQAENLRDVTCSFGDGKGVRVQYDHSEKARKNGPPLNEAWSPANHPMVLFLDTDIVVGGAPVPLGAYRLYVIPGKTNWELAVNKGVGNNAKRDASQDIAKTAMQTGQLEGGEEVATIYLAQIGAKQCNVRVVYGKTMAWGEIHEK